MDPQEWLAFINLHGGIIGHVPYRTKAEQDGTVDPNPKPPMNLNFKDGSSMQAIFEDDGSVTVTQPLKPGKGVTLPTAPKIITLGDGSKASENPDGTLTIQSAPDTTPTPKDTVPGSGTSATPGTLDQNGDPIGATPGTPDLPVDAFSAQNTAKNDAAARAISQQNADTATANSKETAKQNQIANDRAAAKDWVEQRHQETADKLAANQLTLDQAKLQAEKDQNAASNWLTQRSQNLDYLGKQSFVTAGQYGALQSDESNLAKTGGVSFTPSPTPPSLGYDPAQLAASLARQVLGSTQQVNQPFSLGQAAAASPGPGFVAPSFEQGGQQTNNPATTQYTVAARR